MRSSGLVFAVLLLGCSCGEAEGLPDSGATRDAGPEGGPVDAAADAAPDGGVADAAAPDGGLASLPDCRPESAEWFGSRALVLVENVDRTDTEYVFAVVESGEGHLRLESDFDEDPQREGTIVADWPVSDARAAPLSIGAQVIVVGGSCYGDQGYVRVMTLEHELVFEGSDPACTAYRPEQRDLRLSLREAEPDGLCKETELFSTDPESECCCVTRRNMEVVLTVPDEEPLVLADGDARDVVIDGQTFVAISQGAYALFDGPCTADVTTPFGVGSAYLLRISP